MHCISLIAQATEHITDQLDFTAGIRETHENKEYTYQSFFGRLGPYTVDYNHLDWKGALSFKFTSDVLAEIYLGKIKKWNDPKIRASNRNANLPDSEIVVIHRSDGSGTTFVWTDFLSKVNAQWKAAVGSGAIVPWPVGTGAEGNNAVATMVQQTPNSLAYVELVYALRHQLNFGAVQNAAGQFVQADLASVTAAASGAASAMTSDFRVSITNAPGKGAYPISSFTWLLIPSKIVDASKRDAVKDFLKWMMTDGQQYCEPLAYAKLPKEVVVKELKAIDKIQ